MFRCSSKRMEPGGMPVKVSCRTRTGDPALYDSRIVRIRAGQCGKENRRYGIPPELAEILLKKKRTECVTEEDIARLAASDLAGRKRMSWDGRVHSRFE